MRRYGNLWGQIIAFENVLLAFRKAARGKGYETYALRFVQNLEHNLVQLQCELASRSYRPGAYRSFYIYEPKKRMISAAPFVDRIVHHCLINVIGPILESTFIEQSYANRVGKGTHRAIRDVQNAMRLNRYVLHSDIRKYFPTIDHEILKALIRRKIKDPNALWLSDLIIDCSNPQEEVIDYFPGDGLFAPIQRRKGLPIGNLTSQFFANLYLSGLDHFAKEQLRCRFYFRYVDDIVVASSDKDFLWSVREEIGAYIETLRLRLHPDKCHVRPVTSGLRFLGQVIYPHRRFLPKRNVRRFMRRMQRFQRLYAAGEMELETINQSLQSWLGHAKQAHTYALREGLLERIRFERN